LSTRSDLAYLRDAFVREFDAVVIAVDGDRVALDASYFYPTGGGQPHDTGSMGQAYVADVRKDSDLVWHTLQGPIPAVGESVHCILDWERRYQLMRTHTAMHILCGVI
jgi:misacylated tRNA(Ala) deacylase